MFSTDSAGSIVTVFCLLIVADTGCGPVRVGGIICRIAGMRGIAGMCGNAGTYERTGTATTTRGASF